MRFFLKKIPEFQNLYQDYLIDITQTERIIFGLYKNEYIEFAEDVKVKEKLCEKSLGSDNFQNILNYNQKKKKKYDTNNLIYAGNGTLANSLLVCKLRQKLDHKDKSDQGDDNNHEISFNAGKKNSISSSHRANTSQYKQTQLEKMKALSQKKSMIDNNSNKVLLGPSCDNPAFSIKGDTLSFRKDSCSQKVCDKRSVQSASKNYKDNQDVFVNLSKCNEPSKKGSIIFSSKRSKKSAITLSPRFKANTGNSLKSGSQSKSPSHCRSNLSVHSTKNCNSTNKERESQNLGNR